MLDNFVGMSVIGDLKTQCDEATTRDLTLQSQCDEMLPGHAIFVCALSIEQHYALALSQSKWLLIPQHAEDLVNDL